MVKLFIACFLSLGLSVNALTIEDSVVAQIEHLRIESKRALEESITNQYNGRAIEYIKYSQDCNAKISELIIILNKPTKR